MDTADEGFKPPYMSFQTFWNFIRELSAKPLPPRIDRSLMTAKSGTDQFNLNLALTSFGLIDDNNNVLPQLQELATADEQQRKTILTNMISQNYVGPMRVSANHGTSKDLEDAFRESYPSIASPDTRRKAITFFLHAARVAGLELSVHFPKTRSGPGAPGISKPKKQSVRRKPASQQEPVKPTNSQPDTPETGDTYRFDLRSGGKISAVVDVNIFQLSTEDRDYVIDLVDKLKGYPNPTAGSSSATGSNKNGPSEEGPSGRPSGDGGVVTPT